jgi:hypothetical protein
LMPAQGDLRHIALCAQTVHSSHMAVPFAILNSRKRAVIALIHSVFFLGLATRDWAVSARLGGVVARAHVPAGAIALVCIYGIVSAVLLTLFLFSAGMLERLYFAFCAASASSGLVRAVLGDARFTAGSSLRVIMLVSTVVVGWLLLRMHSSSGNHALKPVLEQS